MKNRLFIGFLACLALVLTACNEQQCRFHNLLIELPVKQNEWQFDQDAQRYFVHISVPSITWDIYNYGTWTVSREYNFNTADAYQVVLPESTYKVEELADGSKAYYTQHIDYAVGQGWVEITLTISDYVYQEVPEAMHFVLQIVY